MMVRRLALKAAALVLAMPMAAFAQEPDPLARAVALIEAERYAEAREVLEPLAAGRSPAADAAYYMGRASLALGDLATASDWLERAVRQESARAEYQLWLGRAYAEQAMQANPVRQASLARRMRRAWERAIALDPALVDARADLVRYYMIAPAILGGSTGKALEEVEAIERLNPYRGLLARAFIHEHDADTVALGELLRAGIETYPDSLALRYRVGFLHQAAQRWDAAFEAFEDIVQRDAGEMMALYQVGRTGALSGSRLDLAEARLRGYLEGEPGPGDPSHAWARVRLGNIYEHAGRTDQARSEYQAALSLDPRLNAAREGLARVQ